MGVCLATAVATATLAANAFTLAWTHSIERLRWEEDWRTEGAELVLDGVRVRGHGAGMEPPAGAVYRPSAPTVPPSWSSAHCASVAGALRIRLPCAS